MHVLPRRGLGLGCREKSLKGTKLPIPSGNTHSPLATQVFCSQLEGSKDIDHVAGGRRSQGGDLQPLSIKDIFFFTPSWSQWI